MQLKLANVALYVTDEISMVGSNTFRHVWNILKIKQNTTDWGSLSRLAIGDFYQLPKSFGPPPTP